MTHRLRRWVWILAVPALALTMMACSDDDDDASPGDASPVTGTGGAESELCDSLDDVDTALMNVQDLSSSSTLEDAEEARDQLQDAVEEAVDQGGDVAQAQITALQTAYNAFNTAVDSLPADATLGNAASALANLTRGVADAFEDTETELRCP